MKIIISNKVKETIVNIFKYSSNISVNYARKVVSKIYESIYNLQNSPYIGRYIPELYNKYYRERICQNYRIIYFISEKNDTIYIQYIISSKQNSNLFFQVHEKELIDFIKSIVK